LVHVEQQNSSNPSSQLKCEAGFATEHFALGEKLVSPCPLVYHMSAYNHSFLSQAYPTSASSDPAPPAIREAN
jgi:hypothetical protein